ncbi:non-homologous end-joining DNA ligase [Nocardioides mesophilus]|uniref:ATP-dependent DNA ligase n=1 Tax=Nocardioides mesophilus TaxID=433659 RepID=A0A7G9RDB5_9ACTN|nr:non-homologous end-joining DNA ligase [Nocardioides mesophilus]QNN53590.1 ATP-dependent DNA ligase [Nocardioides mesophilus]
MPGEVMVEVDGRTLKISNLDKVLYPMTGTTKGEVLHYYAQVAPVLLPHVADRAVTRIRWPDGTGGNQFFEKNQPSGAPSWLRTVKMSSTGSRGGGDTIYYPVIDDLATLTYLVNLASLELHVHQWKVGGNGRPKNPDRLVIDLDPGAPAGLGECCQVALLVRDRLAEMGLASAPVTSGSKGLHLYAALPGKKNADEVRDLAQQIAQEMAEERGDLVVWKMTKALRPGKVFLDWSQNTGSKTTISPYSLRGRAQPYVAAPRTWEEIEAGAADPEEIDHLLMDEVLARVEAHGDIFGDLLHQA